MVFVIHDFLKTDQLVKEVMVIMIRGLTET